MSSNRPKVVIIGAGFGGLYAATTLAKTAVDVLLIDRQNFHTFTPLLYQVATCGLDPSEVAYPVRSIFRDKPNVQFLFGEVQSVDYDDHKIVVQTNGTVRDEIYDYLIVAAGSVTNYFGIGELEQFAFGLKGLSDAVVLRNHLLKLFERAAWAEDETYRTALTTIVVVGGGPTGLETAGALYELYNYVLHKEFTSDRPVKARVILIEATDRLLAPYPESLREAALQQLESMGVEVMLNASVEWVEEGGVHLKEGDFLPTHTLIWAAGVKASSISAMLDVELQRGGRIPVAPTLEVIGRERIYAVGDIAYLEDAKHEAYPMVIPVAKQQGILAGKNILKHIAGDAQTDFRYIDRGLMATIGRRRAVAWLYYRIQLTGYLAWLTWLGAHLIWLLGFRNRAVVFVTWVWNYLTYDRSVRIILEPKHRQWDEKQKPTRDFPIER